MLPCLTHTHAHTHTHTHTPRSERSSFEGEETNKPINEVVKFVQWPNSSTLTPFIHTDDLVGRTFLLDPADDATRHRAKIIRKIVEHDEHLAQSMHKFLVSIDAQDSDEIMTYSDIMDYLDRNANSELDEGYWKFKRILSHHGPFKPGDPLHKGSSWNVRIEWEDGSITDEPLDLISKDDPVTLAIYARDHDLLNTPGWKRLRRIANTERK